jgi:hypothetical protein
MRVIRIFSASDRNEKENIKNRASLGADQHNQQTCIISFTYQNYHAYISITAIT